jgi:FkbM family methyltransferase
MRIKDLRERTFRRRAFNILLKHPTLVFSLFKTREELGRLAWQMELAKYARLYQRYLESHNSEYYYQPDGFYICLNPQDTEISAHIAIDGCWEPETTELVKKLIRPNSFVVDVGANIGWFTLISAKRASIVHAFEPETVNYSLLERSITINSFKNIVLRQLCISDYEGTAELHLSKYTGRHSIIGSGERKVVVPCTTLDRLYPTETIDLLKIDVEGAEPEVILGAKQIIQEKRVKHVIMEWNPKVWTGKRHLLDYFNIFHVDGKTAFEFPDGSINAYMMLR